MKRLTRLTTAVAVAALLAAAVQPTTATAAPRAAASRGFGYVWAHSPSTAAYTPTSSYSRNSTGGVNTINRLGTGRYVVHLPNLGTYGGTAHATAYGASNATCQVGAWLVAGTRLDLYVNCFTATGVPADNQFTASFTNRPPAGRLAYLWADQPSVAAYTPSTTYQWSSVGGTNTVLRQGVGSYLVQLPGLGASRGHVQVTAYGSTATRCKVVSWGPSGTTERIGVRCFNAAGFLTDARYSLTFVDGRGPLWTTAAAYLWANAPTAASYVPSAPYRYNSTGGTNTVRRLGTGSYLVNLPGQPLSNGTVLVTAYGAGSQRCNVNYWTSSGVQVLCRTSAGVFADTLFDLAFQR